MSLDCRALDWISAHSDGMRIQHNAHHESRTTVERHLLHRQRLGEQILFADQSAEAACSAKDSLWEVTVVRTDGTELHIAGPAIAPCIAMVQSMLGASMRNVIAA